MAKENSQKAGPGVSWAGVQGLIMESFSHEQTRILAQTRQSNLLETGDFLLLFALLFL